MQTAIEFLIEKLNKLETEKHLYKVIDYRVKKQIIIEEAKQMFEEQITDAYNEGDLSVIKDVKGYYNQTFKK